MNKFLTGLIIITFLMYFFYIVPNIPLIIWNT